MLSFFKDDVTITLSPQDVADTVTFDAQGTKYEGPRGTIGSRLIKNMAIRYNVPENFATDEGVIPACVDSSLIVSAVCDHNKHIFFVLNKLGDLKPGKDVQFQLIKSFKCGCDDHFEADYRDLSLANVESNVENFNVSVMSGATLNVPAIKVENDISGLEMDVPAGNNHNQMIQRYQAEIQQLKLQFEQHKREAHEREQAIRAFFLPKMAKIEEQLSEVMRLNDVIVKAASDQQKVLGADDIDDIDQ